MTAQATELELRQQLATKFSNLIDSLEPIAKAGYNEHFRYNYVKEEDLVTHLRSKLAQYGLAMIWEARSESYRPAGKNGESGITTLELGWRLIDLETGFELQGSWLGQGQDGQDKGVYKAMTGGIKYFYLKNLLISTGDDPERSSGGGGGGGGQQQRRQGGGGQQRSSGGGQKQRSPAHQKALDYLSPLVNAGFPDDLELEFRGRRWKATRFFADETTRKKSNSFEDYARDAAKALYDALQARQGQAGGEKGRQSSQDRAGRANAGPGGQPQPRGRGEPQGRGGDERPISPAQEKRLWAIATKAGWTHDAVKLLLSEAQPPIAHSRDVPRDLYDELVQKLENRELAERYNAEAEETLGDDRDYDEGID
ncbi:MAG TPA: ERF family protein [Anaeromyxobacteraceae bacterium]|nr:ERF family protein [Anaeromyxobacteraceae bacterium]